MPPETIELEEIGAPAPATAGERRRAPPVAWVIAVVAVVALVVTSGIAWHLHDQLSGARHRNALETPTTAVRLPRVAVNPDSGTGEFTAHLTTLEGHGLVAIASEGHLRIIDGQHQLVRDIYRDTAVTRPAWSPSGRWLSYGFDNTEVWVTTAEETQAHQVGSVAAVQADQGRVLLEQLVAQRPRLGHRRRRRPGLARQGVLTAASRHRRRVVAGVVARRTKPRRNDQPSSTPEAHRGQRVR